MKNIILLCKENFEMVVDTDTGEILCESKSQNIPIRAEDLLFALGYKFEIEELE